MQHQRANSTNSTTIPVFEGTLGIGWNDDILNLYVWLIDSTDQLYQ